MNAIAREQQTFEMQIVLPKAGKYLTHIVKIVVAFHVNIMMTSSNGNIFRVTGPLCGEFTGHR